MRLKLLVLTLTIIGVLAVASSAGAGWSNYFGPATMTHSNYNPRTGTNYWTNNRVYRPQGHPFVLAYWNTGTFHYSTENYNDNPFYFPSYGYNTSYCTWYYWDDLSPNVSPVTCQVFI